MANQASDHAGTPNLVGYARVSARDQEPGSQESALFAAGCSRVFVDHGESSRIRDRPECSPAWTTCDQATR